MGVLRADASSPKSWYWDKEAEWVVLCILRQECMQRVASSNNNFGPLYSQDTPTYLSLSNICHILNKDHNYCCSLKESRTYMYIGFLGNAIPEARTLLFLLPLDSGVWTKQHKQKCFLGRSSTCSNEHPTPFWKFYVIVVYNKVIKILVHNHGCFHDITSNNEKLKFLIHQN